jgi:outer membrane protein assembly factor BamA
LAQEFTIESISLSGNTRTKAFILENEILFEEGKTYKVDSLNELIKQSENRLLNLNLFNTVNISYQSLRSSKPGRVHITVVEKWYIWPIPFVEFSDRNFNVWSGLDFDPKRTNYGLYVFNYNLFGRNHTLKTKMKTGYNTKLGVEYRIPFLSRNSQWGLNSIIEYKSQNEVWLETINDSLQFFKNGQNNLIKNTYGRIELTKRIRPFIKIYGGIELAKGVLDTSVTANDYFINNADYQTHYALDFKAEIDTRDNIYYPTIGKFYQPKVSLKQWTNTTTSSNLKLELKLQNFHQLSKKWFSAISVYGNYNTQDKLPYSLRQMFGYDEIIRGFENYVVDGNAAFKYNVSAKYHLLDKSNMKLNFIPIKNYKILPVNVYAEVFSDGGRVNYQTPDFSNELVNTFLYSGGLGLNALFYNDRLLRLEYSLNSLKEGGFFVHFKKAI